MFEKKVRIIKTPAGFTNSRLTFVINALTHCATLLGNNFGRENIKLFILDFVYFDKKFDIISKCPILPFIRQKADF